MYMSTSYAHMHARARHSLSIRKRMQAKRRVAIDISLGLARLRKSNSCRRNCLNDRMHARAHENMHKNKTQSPPPSNPATVTRALYFPLAANNTSSPPCPNVSPPLSPTVAATPNLASPTAGIAEDAGPDAVGTGAKRPAAAAAPPVPAALMGTPLAAAAARRFRARKGTRTFASDSLRDGGVGGEQGGGGR